MFIISANQFNLSRDLLFLVTSWMFLNSTPSNPMWQIANLLSTFLHNCTASNSHAALLMALTIFSNEMAISLNHLWLVFNIVCSNHVLIILLVWESHGSSIILGKGQCYHVFITILMRKTWQLPFSALNDLNSHDYLPLIISLAILVS